MSKRKLLLADDSATIQKVVNLTFADEGIEVTAAADGNSAMQKFAANPPDLVMADVNLPGIDGYKICETIKRDENTKHIPVILLVGSFEPFDEEKARRVGADDYMTKPFQSIRQLVTKVSGLLNNEDAAAAADETGKAAPDETAENSAVEASENASHTVSAETDGDTQIDEEAAETNQTGSLSADAADGFSTASPAAEDSPQAQTTQTEQTFNGSGDDSVGEDETQTQSLDAADRDKANSSGNVEHLSDDETGYDLADEDSIRTVESEDDETSEADETNEQSFAPPQKEDEIDSPKNPFAGFELDEMNLLELSFDDDEFYQFEDEPIEESGLTKFVEAGESASPALSEMQVSYTAREFQTEMPAGQQIYETDLTGTATENQASFENISPALIDAIAARVVEKLSDRAIREIAAEVVPQMADSIIRQMARDEFSN